MIVLDTNVISERTRQAPDDGVVAWLDRCPVDDVFIAAVTAAELRCGVARLPDGHRKTTLTATLAEILAEELHMADAQIAAICRYHDATLATRNVKDFIDTGVRVRDPWNSDS